MLYLFRGLLLRAPYSLCERCRKLGDRVDGLTGGATVRIEAAAQSIDQRRADHRAVGALGNRARRFRRPYAEADTDRKLGMPLDPRDGAADGLRIGGAAAGDTGDRDVVDKARSVGEHGRQPL